MASLTLTGCFLSNAENFLSLAYCLFLTLLLPTYTNTHPRKGEFNECYLELRSQELVPCE